MLGQQASQSSENKIFVTDFGKQSPLEKAKEKEAARAAKERKAKARYHYEAEKAKAAKVVEARVDGMALAAKFRDASNIAIRPITKSATLISMRRGRKGA